MVLPKLKSQDTQQCKFSCFKAYTINPLFSPQGAYLLQAHLRRGGGGANETGGGLFEMGGGLFILEKDDHHQFSIKN